MVVCLFLVLKRVPLPRPWQAVSGDRYGDRVQPHGIHMVVVEEVVVVHILRPIVIAALGAMWMVGWIPSCVCYVTGMRRI